MSEWRPASRLRTALLDLAKSRIRSATRYGATRLRRSTSITVPGGAQFHGRQAKVTVMKVLMVITSHDQVGNTGRKTGFWLEELAAPYYVFKDAGAEVTLASPKGGRPPLDPKSNEPEFRTELTFRFEKDAAAEAQLGKTLRLDG